MIGFDGIGFHAIGEMITSLSAPLTYEPVSRIVAGGWSNGRPVAVAVLGAELLWDNGDYIVYDNGDHINWS
jgi:hypothetical protein